MNVRNNHEMPSNIEPLKEDPGETEISLQSICILDASLSRFAAALPDFLEVHVRTGETWSDVRDVGR